MESIEKQLRESKEREREMQLRIDELTDFVEQARIPLHWVNGSGIVMWANQAELDLLGYEKEEYIGKHISNFHSDKRICEDVLTRLINKETLHNYPATLLTKEKKPVPVLISSNVRWEGEKFIHTRCFTRDISDLRKLQEEKVNLINELQEANIILKSENIALKKQLASSKI